MKKVKENKFNNNYIYGFIFIIFSIIIEIVTFMRLNLGFLPTYFVIEFLVILILAGFIFIIPTEALKIILMSVFLGVQLIIGIVNSCLYTTISDLVTIDMIFTISGEGANAFEFNHLDLVYIIISIVIITLLVITIILANKFMPKYRLKKKKSAKFILTLLLILFQVMSASLLSAAKHYTFQTKQPENLMVNNEYLYSTLNVKYTSLKKFGFWPFYLNNTKQCIFGNNLSKEEKENLSAYINQGKDFKYTNSIYNEQNISGSLKDDNLIIIMMESVEWFAIDEYNTPSLYKLIEDSIQFQEFYATNKTNISEQIALIGSTTNTTSLQSLASKNKLNAPNSLPNLFKQQNYESVNFFHSYLGDFYDRNSINTALGFNNVYSIEDYQNEFNSSGFGDFIDDGVFIDSFKKEFMPRNQKFFSFYTTVTTHGPYEKSYDRYKEYYDRFDKNYNNYRNTTSYNLPEYGTKEYNILKEYKSRAMAVDNTIEIIFQYLNSTTNHKGENMLDNTTIILYADHNAYYSDLTYLIKDINIHNNSKDVYNIPFSIYSSKLKSGKVKTFCNTFDIFPTICDLYGMNFNKNLIQGHSVFSEDIKNSVFISSKSGIFDENFYAITLDEIIAKDNSIETNSNLQKFKNNVNMFLQKQQYIENYYRINYEKYIQEHK